MNSSRNYDVIVVGAGLVGLSTARALCDSLPDVSIAILEKEAEFAMHQSSHNSGVVHSGLYYKPGSLKARLCLEGRRATYELCAAADITHKMSGKLVIAVDESELPALDELERRGHANGLKGLRRIGSDQIKEFEPEAIGLAALHVPEAGVADFKSVAAHHVETLIDAGTDLVTQAEVTAVAHEPGGVSVVAGGRRFTAAALVNCAGLQSDLVARLAGLETRIRVVPFRGEYYGLAGTRANLVRTLIYPVPDPRFPFLGVHFTRRFDGSVEVGPNAVLAYGREHYRGKKPDWSELRKTLSYPGFRKLARKHWRAGLSEILNSRSRRRYARLARRLVPALQPEDLTLGGSGVRAQAVDTAGNLVDDFVIEKVGNSIHVLNAPSPAATASPAIGRYIAAEVEAVLRE